MTDEERLAILGPDVIARIDAAVDAAVDPTPEQVEVLRRFFVGVRASRAAAAAAPRRTEGDTALLSGVGMTAAEPFSLAEAKRRIGPAAVEAARRNVEAAPPLRPELREQIRAAFMSARIAGLPTAAATEPPSARKDTMPRKSDRRGPLPAGLVPLLTQRELETYYDVSDWTVLKWIEAGMPVEPMRVTGTQKAARRFDLAAVKAWHSRGDLMTREERLAIPGPEVIAVIKARVAEATPTSHAVGYPAARSGRSAKASTVSDHGRMESHHIRPGHLTAEQTREVLGISAGALRNLVYRGRLTRTGGTDRHPHFALTDVTTLLTERQARAAA